MGVEGKDFDAFIYKYCCVVWYHTLPSCFFVEVERKQKRAFMVIEPTLSHREALQYLKLPRLDKRRSELCLITLPKILTGAPLFKHSPTMRASVPLTKQET